MNQKKLKKELGINQERKIRDAYGVLLAEDMSKTHLKLFKEFVDVEIGDFVIILSFKKNDKRN